MCYYLLYLQPIGTLSTNRSLAVNYNICSAPRIKNLRLQQLDRILRNSELRSAYDFSNRFVDIRGGAAGRCGVVIYLCYRVLYMNVVVSQQLLHDNCLKGGCMYIQAHFNFRRTDGRILYIIYFTSVLFPLPSYPLRFAHYNGPERFYIRVLYTVVEHDVMCILCVQCVLFGRIRVSVLVHAFSYTLHIHRYLMQYFYPSAASLSRCLQRDVVLGINWADCYICTYSLVADRSYVRFPSAGRLYENLVVGRGWLRDVCIVLMSLFGLVSRVCTAKHVLFYCVFSRPPRRIRFLRVKSFRGRS